MDINFSTTFDKIKFNSTNPIHIKQINNKNPQVVNFSIDYRRNLPGVYHGNLIVSSEKGNNSTFIPYTLDIQTNIIERILLVIDGIIISILLWKFVIYHNKKSSYNHFRKSIKSLSTDTTTDRFEKIKVMSNHPKFVDNYYKFNPNLESDKELNLKNYVETSVTREKSINELIGIGGTIIFGIAVSILGLLNNDYIMTLHNIGPREALVLVGIGLGIGSLKDLVQKNQ